MTIDLKNQKQSVKIAIVVVVVLVITLAAFFLVRSRTSESQNATKELEDIVSELSKTIDLPEEVPTIATVTDKNLLNEQEFFSRAENGDKVVIFQVWRKAILYRPSSKKIIDLTNISANQGPE
jgi:predicted PurR-regulated permease PerM